jgi:hypothetical protein
MLPSAKNPIETATKSGAMLPWASESAFHPALNSVVIANPGSRRVVLFQAALATQGLPAARLVAWSDLIAGRVVLPEVVRRGDLVRIESPGKDFEVERALLMLGAAVEDDESGYQRLSRQQIEQLVFEKGRILAARQWYLGFLRALQTIERQLEICPEHRVMNAPAAIAAMFDKCACQGLMLARGVPVPPALPPVHSYEELIWAMRVHGWGRVFIKPAHLSSASGVIAYQTGGTRHQATTTVEMARQSGELCLYNSRRMQIYTGIDEIAALVDAVCRQRVHVERWLPKAGLGGAIFDLRVVVIAGRARHVAVRSSRTPITNLHLLNTRGDPDIARERMGDVAWAAAIDTCERALALFPASLYAGIDLLISPNYRRHAVLEINAFGDLLPNLLSHGQDSYAAEIEAMQADNSASQPVPPLRFTVGTRAAGATQVTTGEGTA